MDEFPRRGHGADRHLDHRGLARPKRGLEGGAQLLGAARPTSGGAKTLCILDEIWIGEVAGDQPITELLFLDAPDIAESTVGEHDRDQGDAVADGSGKFVDGGKEAAAAVSLKERT